MNNLHSVKESNKKGRSKDWPLVLSHEEQMVLDIPGEEHSENCMFLLGSNTQQTETCPPLPAFYHACQHANRPQWNVSVELSTSRSVTWRSQCSRPFLCGISELFWKLPHNMKVCSVVRVHLRVRLSQFLKLFLLLLFPGLQQGMLPAGCEFDMFALQDHRSLQFSNSNTFNLNKMSICPWNFSMSLAYNFWEQ